MDQLYVIIAELLGTYVYTPSQDENSGKREIIFLGIPAQLGSIFNFEIQHKNHIVRSAVKIS